jgi:hypothetical protein
MTGNIEQSSAKIKLFGARNSPPAYSIRDFLQRRVVAFEWIELQDFGYSEVTVGWQIFIVSTLQSEPAPN